jgi:ribonuclease HI
MEGKVRLEKWPSSTKAELAAVMMVVLVVVNNSRVVIKLDSSAAIASLEREKPMFNIRAWSKTKNFRLVMKIKDMCKSKNIELVLVKVKAHSGVVWHERADKLAKEGALLGECSDLKLERNCRFPYMLYWKDSVVEVPTRKFMKTLTNMMNGAEWRCSNAAKELEPDAEAQCDWRRLWKENRNLTGNKCKTLEESKRISFRIKCITDSLPVLKVLKKRAPDLYDSDLCKECKTEEESSRHLFICKEYKSYWNNIKKLACWLV